MAVKTYPTILKYGVQASYDALATKDAKVLYFCTDTKKIYKGDVDFSDSVIVAATKPETGIVAGKLYVLADTGTVEVYSGAAWHVVSYPTATVIDASADDTHVATAKAVYDAIQGAISGEGVVNSIATGTAEGTISVTASGETSDVKVHGVVTTPSYDAATRKFTFPVSDGDDVVVELGKDIFVDPTANNRYENGNLYIYLNDGTEGKAATELVIPVTSLITDYFGEATDTIQVNVDAETHKVTANAILKADGEGFTNALKSDAAGLYVDLSTYATTAYVDSEIDRVEATADAASAKATANEIAIGVLNGDSATAGSVANTVAAAVNGLETGAIKDAADAAAAAQKTADDNAAAITVLNGDDTTAGSVAKSVADAVAALDATVTQTAGADGVSAEVVEEDGKLTSVKVAIAANTYDAYGAAAAVQGSTTKTVADLEAALTDTDTNIENLAAAATVWGTF